MRPRWLTLSTALVLGLGGATAARAQCAGDLDCDTVLDGADNCPFVWNLDQADTSGVGGPPGDGVGDVCQCGDVDEDGGVDLLDFAIYRRALDAQSPSIANAEKCSTVGGRLDCEPNDVTAIRGDLAGLGAGVMQVCQAAVGAPPLPANMSAAGDSITRAFAANCTCNDLTNGSCALCLLFGDLKTQFSWFDGSSASVTSLKDWYALPPLGVAVGSDMSTAALGLEMVAGAGNFAEQAADIVNQFGGVGPDLVVVELGGNDICSRQCTDSANCGAAALYDDETWADGVRAGLDVLVGPDPLTALPDGATVYLLGVPRVHDLRAAGMAKEDTDTDCDGFWIDQDICTVATLDADLMTEPLAQRLAAIAERQRRYNEILRDLALEYSSNPALNPRGIEVVSDYVNEATPSVGTTPFGPDEINGGDCFHPSIAGQNLLSATAWNADPRR